MSFWDHYSKRVAADPAAPAVRDQQGAFLSHGELHSRGESVAVELLALGLSPGEHLGVFLPNRAIWPVLAMAAARSGIGILGLNTRFREAELNHLLGVADVQTVVVAQEFLGIDGPALMASLDRPVEVLIDGVGPLDPEAKFASSVDRTLPPADDGRLPIMGFTTSGTTGFPKVAMHDQTQALYHLTAAADSFRLATDSVTLVPLPFCGAFGYTAAMATLLAGGSVVLHETWDADEAAAAIDTHGVTYCSASDDMLLAVASSERFVSPTTWTDGGFADFTNVGAEAVTAVESNGGGATRLTGLYGSSEGFAMMSSWDPGLSLEDRCRNGGHLIGNAMAVRCCDPETGVVLADGESGELQFTGPNLISGYLNNPEATTKAFTADGWYRSGDLGYTVDPDNRGHGGFVYLARLGDTLRLRGFLCDPAEIERHLERHEAVELAQVVGVKRPGVGDVAVAFVRLDPAAPNVDQADLKRHCQTGLANYKRPAHIEIVEEFPVTDGPNGVKIRKVDLREQAVALID